MLVFTALRRSVPWGLLSAAWQTQCPSHLSLKNCGLTAFALSKLRIVLAPHVCHGRTSAAKDESAACVCQAIVLVRILRRQGEFCSGKPADKLGIEVCELFLDGNDLEDRGAEEAPCSRGWLHRTNCLAAVSVRQVCK